MENSCRVIVPSNVNTNTQFRRNESIAAYKQYSRTANHTLTKFTNDMSEILRQSIERLDNISLKVRNCVYELENQSYAAKRVNVEQRIDEEDDPLLAVIEYKSKDDLLQEAVEASREADETVRKAQEVFNEQPGRRKTKKLKPSESRESTCTTCSKRDNFTCVDFSMRKERSVMQKIRESYKKLRAKTLSAAEKASCEEQLRLLRREFASQRRKRWLNVKKREMVVKKGQEVAECYDNERFDDSNWFGPKITVESDARLTSTSSKRLPSPRDTRLTRKYARENFHAPKGPKSNSRDGKAVKMVTERKDEPLNVIMHTQKHPRYELKQNSPFAASSILDDVTLKDLEPLQAEYPRKDNIFNSEPAVEPNLLYKLVNEDARALELLINVNAHLNHRNSRKLRHKRRSLSKPIHANKFAIEDIPEEDPKQLQNESRMKVGDVASNAIDLNDYRSYRNLVSKEGRQRLKKYVLDPPAIHRTYIVMPVLVQFDKDISPHLPKNLYKEPDEKVKELERKRKCIFTEAKKTEDFLKPYIFDMGGPDRQKTPETDTTVMTVTMPSEIPKNVLETMKGRKMSLEVSGKVKSDDSKGTMLVQKMMTYDRNQSKKISPRVSGANKKSDNNQQLISFIVNPEKVDPVFPSTSASPRKKTQPKKSPKAKENQEPKRSTPTMKAINKLEKEVNSKGEMELTSTTTTTFSGTTPNVQLESENELEKRVLKRSKITALPSKQSIPPKSTPKSTSLNLLEVPKAKPKHEEHRRRSPDEVAKRILSKWQSLENPSIGDLPSEEPRKNYMFIKSPGGVSYESAKNRKDAETKHYKHFSKEVAASGSKDKVVEPAKKKSEYRYEYKRKGPEVEIRKVENKEEKWNNRDLELFVAEQKRKKADAAEAMTIHQEPKVLLEPKKSGPHALPERPQTAGQVLDAKTVRKDVGLWVEVKKTPKTLTENKAVDVKLSRKLKRDPEATASLVKITEENDDKGLAKKNIADLEKQLGEETKKFCMEMDQVIKQIQDTSPTSAEPNEGPDLVEILNTKYAAVTHSIKHVATIKGVVSVRSFAQYFGPTCDVKRQWSESELLITGEVKNEEVVVHTIETVTFPNLQSLSYKNTVSSVETCPIGGDLIFRDSHQGDARSQEMCAPPPPPLLTPADLKHLWLLICVYAMVFAFVFCSLNLKLGCA